MEPGGDLFSARATRLNRGNGAGRLAISVPRLRLFFGGRISPELSSMDRPVVVRPKNDFANTCPLLARCDFDIPFPLSGSSNPTDQHVPRKLSLKKNMFQFERHSRSAGTGKVRTQLLSFFGVLMWHFCDKLRHCFSITRVINYIYM